MVSQGAPWRVPVETDGEKEKMKIVESVCGNCGAKDSLFPVPREEGPQAWRCEACGEVFREKQEDEEGGVDEDSGEHIENEKDP